MILEALTLLAIAAPHESPEHDAAPAAADSGVAVPASEAWRSERPKAGAPKPPKLPRYDQAVLDNGLTIIVAEVDTVPIVSFSLVTKGGSMLDPKGGAGLASITYELMGESTQALSALEFSDAVADLGASFSSNGDRDRGSVSISGLASNADGMLALLADAALRPRFDPKDFERVKSQTIASLLRRRGSPQGLAFEQVPALIYGEDHPYGHPPTGSVDSVQTLNLDAVKEFFERMMSPKHSALLVAGSMPLAEVKALAEKHLGTWKRDVEALPEVPAAAPKAREAIVLIDKPGAAQTMTIIGRPLFERGHPDEAALTLANDVYGGSFASRLNMNLREDKAITYGAGSSAAFRQGTGVFIAYSAIRADATALGLKEIFAELEGMTKTPPTEEEVGRARDALIKSLSGTFERSGAIAGAAATLFVYGLPLDYYDKITAKYDAADLASVRAAAAKYFDPSVMQILLVGDAAGIAMEIDKLGLGKLEMQKP